MDDFEEAAQEAAAGISLALVAIEERKKRAADGEDLSDKSFKFSRPVVEESDYLECDAEMINFNKTLKSAVNDMLQGQVKDGVGMPGSGTRLHVTGGGHCSHLI